MLVFYSYLFIILPHSIFMWKLYGLTTPKQCLLCDYQLGIMKRGHFTFHDNQDRKVNDDCLDKLRFKNLHVLKSGILSTFWYSQKVKICDKANMCYYIFYLATNGLHETRIHIIVVLNKTARNIQPAILTSNVFLDLCFVWNARNRCNT